MSATVGLAVGVSVACWLATTVRWVPPGTLLAATRRGLVRRVYDAGPAWRLPWIEGFESTPAAPHAVPLTVRATTDDGIRVLVLAEATVTLPRPEPGMPYVDPWPAAEGVAEDAIARAVAGWSTAELATAAATHQRALRHAVSAAVDGWGVALLDLDLVEVGLPLDTHALDRGPR